MGNLKYIKSKQFDNTFFYECNICGFDHREYMGKCAGFNCKCGAKFTRKDIDDAMEEYINSLG